MTKYNKQKQAIRNALNKFDITDNLFNAVEAYILLGRLLEEQGFPIDIWKQKEQNQ